MLKIALKIGEVWLNSSLASFINLFSLVISNGLHSDNYTIVVLGVLGDNFHVNRRAFLLAAHNIDLRLLHRHNRAPQ